MLFQCGPVKENKSLRHPPKGPVRHGSWHNHVHPVAMSRGVPDDLSNSRDMCVVLLHPFRCDSECSAWGSQLGYEGPRSRHSFSAGPWTNALFFEDGSA